VELVNEPGTLDEALRDIGSYDWITFTSANAVRGMAGRMTALGLDSRSLAGVKVATVGPATARAVEEILAIGPDLVPKQFLAEEVAAEFTRRGIAPHKVLHPRSDIGRESLPQALREIGAEVTEVTAYRTVRSETSSEDASAAYAAGIDYTTFTSTSGVKNLLEIVDGEPEVINSSRVACIGPITADSCREAGIRVDVLADEQTIDGLVTAVLDDAHEQNGKVKGA
jgi:uroporphyrinogen-III synthase